MPRNNCWFSWSASAFVVVVLAIPAVSRAQTCASNADCAAGLTCQISAVPPQPTVDPTCLKGQTCAGPTPEDNVSTPVPVQSSTCQVAPCKLDSDCAAGMVCHTEKSASCSGGSTAPACPANTVCGAPKPTPPDSCVETTISTCAFKWQLPCSTDQDCGNDFVCAPAVSGTCSSGTGVAGAGSTGTAGGSGAAPAVASDPPTRSPVAPPAPGGGTGVASDGGTTCTTVTSFPGYCQPKAITCAEDTDCPTSWTCAAPPTTATGGASPIAGDGTGSASTASNGTPVPSPKLCRHPLYGAGGRGTATDGNGSIVAGGDAGGQPPMVGKASSESASASADAGCAVAGSGGSAGIGLLSSVLLGLLVSGVLKVRRRTARLKR